MSYHPKWELMSLGLVATLSKIFKDCFPIMVEQIFNPGALKTHTHIYICIIIIYIYIDRYIEPSIWGPEDWISRSRFCLFPTEKHIVFTVWYFGTWHTLNISKIYRTYPRILDLFFGDFPSYKTHPILTVEILPRDLRWDDVSASHMGVAR